MAIHNTFLEIPEPVERAVIVDYDLEDAEPDVGITSACVVINDVWYVDSAGKKVEYNPDDDQFDNLSDIILQAHFVSEEDHRY